VPVSGLAVVAHSAARSSAAFLLSRQSREGCWTDWDLPPGPSDQWTTAYIGCRLAAAPGPLASSSAPARSAAAAWLVEHEFPGGGWGYSDVVGADADSTAWALLFLARQAAPIGRSSYEFLASFQQLDGGFSTYGADAGLGSWCRPQVEVTALAARALLCAGIKEQEWLAADKAAVDMAVRRALRYLACHERPDGTWGSFWWASPLYATAAVLSLVRDTCAVAESEVIGKGLANVVPGNAFEQALLLECLVGAGEFGGGGISVMLDALLGTQLDDGSWPSAPILRLADRDACAPAGPLFADQNRLFTTATVLGALSMVLKSGLAAAV
jgi:squalene cyclase